MKHIYDYKAHGHVLIDSITKYGYSKDEVYEWLEKKLGHNWRYAHFSNVKREWQAQIVIRKLQEMLDTARQRYPNKNRVPNSSRMKPKKKEKPQALTREEIRQALNQVNNKPASLWLRIKNFVSTAVNRSRLKSSRKPLSQ